MNCKECIEKHDRAPCEKLRCCPEKDVPNETTGFAGGTVLALEYILGRIKELEDRLKKLENRASGSGWTK